MAPGNAAMRYAAGAPSDAPFGTWQLSHGQWLGRTDSEA
jgi:hypothetical protein